MAEFLQCAALVAVLCGGGSLIMAVMIRQSNRAYPPLAETVDEEGLPPEIRSRIEQRSAPLQLEGFVRGETFKLAIEPNWMRDYFALFLNHETGERCTVQLKDQRPNPKRGRPPGQATLSFITSYADGFEIVTSNRGIEPFALPEPAHRRVLRLPGVADWRILRRAHALLCKREGHGQPVLPEDALRKECVVRSAVRAAEHYARTGWMELDPAAHHFRFTWKAALWTHCVFPFNEILRYWRQRRSGLATLKELGLPSEYVDLRLYACIYDPASPNRKKGSGPIPLLNEEGCAPNPFRLDGEGRIDEDLSCPECGYSLRELLPSNRCPECSQVVGHSVRGPMLRLCPLWWIRAVREGARNLSWCVLALIATSLPAALIITLLPPSEVARGFASALAMLAMLSLLAIVLHAQPLFARRTCQGEKLFSLRRMNRVAICISALLILAKPTRPYAPFIACFASVPVCTALTLAYVRNLALQIPNPALAHECSFPGLLFVFWALTNMAIHGGYAVGSPVPTATLLGTYDHPARLFITFYAPQLLLLWSLRILWRFRQELRRIDCEIRERCDTLEDKTHTTPAMETTT